MTADTFQKWKDGIVWGVLASIVAWNSWSTLQIFERPTEEDVDQAIATQAPYVKDKSLILETMQEAKESNKELREAIKNNTQAIIRLQVFLERIERERK